MQVLTTALSPAPHRYDRLTKQFCYGPMHQLPAAQLIECPQCQQKHKEEALALQAERDEIRRLDSTEISEGGIWYVVDANWLNGLPTRMQVLTTAPFAPHRYIVDANWLKHWREYCWDQPGRPDPPGPVCNWRLLSSSKMPRPHLERAHDYRGVNAAVWDVFVKRYGGGPPICRAKLDIYAPAVQPPDISAPSRRR